MLPRSGSSPPVATGSPLLGQVVLDVFRDPVPVLLRRWNWKAAALSILFRAPAYVIASLRSAWRETLAALFAESAVCAGTAGFYGRLSRLFERSAGLGNGACPDPVLTSRHAGR